MNEIENKSYSAGDPSFQWFQKEIQKPEHRYRIQNVNIIRNHLLRRHKVLERLKHTYTFKNNMFVPAAIILQGMKTVVNFHTAYLVGNPVSLTGNTGAVEVFNHVYRKGIYTSADWEILDELITYGNAFEYVYLDENRHIKSKVFRNRDSYPIYDSANKYSYFVEYWKDRSTQKEHYTIYFPTHVDTYVDGKLIESKENMSGLPIHYTMMDKSDYDQFGDSMLLDLIPIQDKVEALLSKLDDAITNLSLNPIGIIKGTKLTESDMVNTNVAGAVLQIDPDGDYKYATAQMDYSCIKYELDQLYQQFNMVACIPSSIIGQSNIANVSENTTSIIYQLTENKGKQNMNALMKGFNKRWAYMRKLLALTNNPISDEDFDSLNVSFNIAKPVDTKNDMENMKMQYEMGAISKRTIIERSPYTSDSAQEIQRLAAEGVSIEGE